MNLKVHNDSRFPKKQFHCKSCSFSAEKKDDLISHIVQNHPRKIVCQPCNIILSDRDHQNSHTAWAHEEQSDSYNNSKTGKFACDFCHAKFPSKNSYNSHIEHIHPTQIKRYICDECNIAFYNRNFLKFHIGEIHRHKFISDNKIKVFIFGKKNQKKTIFKQKKISLNKKDTF